MRGLRQCVIHKMWTGSVGQVSCLIPYFRQASSSYRSRRAGRRGRGRKRRRRRRQGRGGEQGGGEEESREEERRLTGRRRVGRWRIKMSNRRMIMIMIRRWRWRRGGQWGG
jgi:hypothetical protein